VFDIALNSLARSRRSRSAAPITARLLRDAAVLVTLARKAMRQSDPRQCHARWTPAQQSRAADFDAGGCLARARSARARKQNVSLNVNGAEQVGPYYATYRSVTSKRATSPSPITGDTPVDTVVTVSGAPTTPEAAADHGFKLERSFHTLDGE
jgi:uncharacterized protein YfaS (alpha-2-macroglobulin family)